MKRNKVKSSNIKSIGYDKDAAVLEIEFNTGAVYHYLEITPEVFNKFSKAESLGKHFNIYIKKYKFVKGEFNKSGHNYYICGRAGGGKDTTADYLIKKFDLTKVKFAYPVYAIATNYMGMGTKEKDKDRELLNFVGTISGRKINKDIWVNRLIEDLQIVKHTGKELYNKSYNFISSDVRFRNEHEILKAQGWIGIFVDAPKDVRIKRLIDRDGKAQEDMLECESEVAVDEFKDELIKLDSSGTIEQTQKNIDELITNLRIAK